MSRDSFLTELNGFLAKHEPVAKPRLYDIGAVLGEWRVTAFLGSGGNAEVYRVVREAGTDGRARSPSAPQPQNNETVVEESVGALKVLLRDDDASRARFAQETKLLKTNTSPSLPRFLDAGLVGRSVPDRRNHDTTKIALDGDCGREGTRGPANDGRPYLVTELLEPVDLPSTEKEIVEYILAVCRAVGVLHHTGLIHRDIKPSNIMRRANGELVLIDLGLVKDAVKSSEPERDVSIVSQKVVAVGTPRFAAPEQMTGGRVTAATDVHAIGRLADVAFRSNPPRPWLPVIRRATSSIPDQRYQTVEDLVRAIKHRNRPRYFAIAAVVCLFLALVGAIVGRDRSPSGPQPPYNATFAERWLRGAEDVAPYRYESAAWDSLCSNGMTNVIDLQLVSDSDNRRVFKKVSRTVKATFVRLNNATNIFHEPLVLSSDSEYFIEGSGILTADIRAPKNGVTVHLHNCIVNNRSPVSIATAGIRYVFARGAYLNFPLADEPDRSTFKSCFANYDAAFNDIRFGGPETPRGHRRRQHEEQLDQLRRATQTFFKNLHFPRHFFASRGKYAVEDMEDSIYKKYGIDPNRIPTDAEVDLVAYCFEVDREEAISILRTRDLKTSARLASGMYDVNNGGAEGSQNG